MSDESAQYRAMQDQVEAAAREAADHLAAITEQTGQPMATGEVTGPAGVLGQRLQARFQQGPIPECPHTGNGPEPQFWTSQNPELLMCADCMKQAEHDTGNRQEPRTCDGCNQAASTTTAILHFPAAMIEVPGGLLIAQGPLIAVFRLCRGCWDESGVVTP